MKLAEMLFNDMNIKDEEICQDYIHSKLNNFDINNGYLVIPKTKHQYVSHQTIAYYKDEWFTVIDNNDNITLYWINYKK